MIYRAPAGHTLLSRLELEQIRSEVFVDNKEKAIEYLDHLIAEIEFYDDIRKMTELKKMHKEEGNLKQAKAIEQEMLLKVRKRQEISKLLKAEFLF